MSTASSATKDTATSKEEGADPLADFFNKIKSSFNQEDDDKKKDANDADEDDEDDFGNIEIQPKTKKESSSGGLESFAKKMFSDFMGSGSSKKDAPANENLIKEETQTREIAEKVKEETNKKSSETGSGSLGSKLFSLVTGNIEAGSEKKALTDIVTQVRESIENKEASGDVKDPDSLAELVGMWNQYKDLMAKVAEKYVGDIDFSRLTPTAVIYYLELEDEIKNPSWKRRQHRFCPGIDFTQIEKLNEACDIALLSYADTVEEIRQGLQNHKPSPYELVYAEVKSTPAKPANFVAVKADQKSFRKGLKVIIGVRGTKTAADAITDLLCDSEEYQGGKGHSFIITSGKFIAEKHHDLLLELLEQSGAAKIDLTLIGHSLGAGAASIAAMEFNDKNSPYYSPKINARAVGFGCPALLSEDLAKQTSDYITTVVNDSDLVPRMSGASAANLMRNILEFDWRDYAKRDLQYTLEDLEERQPFLFGSGATTKVRDLVESLLEKYGTDFVLEKSTKRIEVELFPPGKCLHFYQDGRGISANFVPNTFFDEIDVTRRMVDDHLFFSGYQQTFLTVARQYNRDHHFRFNESEEKE